MKVLVTGAGALLGQGIIRSLMASSLEVEIIAADPSPLSAGLNWTPHRHLLPMARDGRYIEALSAVLERERPTRSSSAPMSSSCCSPNTAPSSRPASARSSS